MAVFLGVPLSRPMFFGMHLSRLGRRFTSYSRYQPKMQGSMVCGSDYPGEMAESAEGARLLSECGGKLPPRVRIPLSPPQSIPVRA